MQKPITKERAEKVARAHACEHCGEYSYKKLTIKPASVANQKEFNEVWHCVKICGVCGREQELGIDAEGEIAYVN
jgi:transcription elongation factor Elf1